MLPYLALLLLCLPSVFRTEADERRGKRSGGADGPLGKHGLDRKMNEIFCILCAPRSCRRGVASFLNLARACDERNLTLSR